MRYDMLDYPTAWEIQRSFELVHHRRCSAVQTNGAMLCDCDAVPDEWERQCAAVSSSPVAGQDNQP